MSSDLRGVWVRGVVRGRGFAGVRVLARRAKRCAVQDALKVLS